MVGEVRAEYTSDWAAVCSVATKLGIGAPQTLMNWVRKAQVDAGQRAGVISAEAAELRRLRAEVKRPARRGPCGFWLYVPGLTDQAVSFVAGLI
jgi:transposase